VVALATPIGGSAQRILNQSSCTSSTEFEEKVMTLAPRDRLIVALDLPSVAAAETLIGQLGDAVTFYKIGYQLAFAGGLPLAQELSKAGKQVFVDLKLHDIGNSVAKGVESVAKLGASFVTVHAYPQTMRAAVEARAGSSLRILAVTVLTSYDDHDLAEAGYQISVDDLVAERAHRAQDIGVDGIVCSPEEAGPLRLIVGPTMALVTPGVRPAGVAPNDQKRVTTPRRAIEAGADYLVVGRPIVESNDPRSAAEAVVAEIAAGAR
jgi:orotidine-5'-phosphate decarboxylase